jgi:hypothetical protein
MSNVSEVNVNQQFLNCSELDYVYTDLMHNIVSQSDGFWISLASTTFVVSMMLLIYGQHIMRQTISFISGSVCLVVVYGTSSFISTLTCIHRVIGSFILALLVACCVSCIIRRGFLLLGVASFVSMTHVTYDALPYDTFPTLFVFHGRNGIYWLSLTGAVVIGGVVASIYKKQFYRIGSSILGGCGLAFCTYILANKIIPEDDHDKNVDEIYLLILACTSSIVGIYIQTHCTKRGAKQNSQQKDRV